MSRMRANSRESDDRLLVWLADRTEGRTPTEIGRDWGVSRGSVSRATDEVRNAELAESGEPDGAVRAGYW